MSASGTKRTSMPKMSMSASGDKRTSPIRNDLKQTFKTTLNHRKSEPAHTLSAGVASLARLNDPPISRQTITQSKQIAVKNGRGGGRLGFGQLTLLNGQEQ